jgi:hypothetical protein
MKKNIVLFGLLLLVLSSCERDDAAFEGPALDDIYGPFVVLQDFDITDRSVDFEAGETTTFTALFSKQVDWEVQIKGLESGAIKSITGFSAELSTSNARWTGTTTEIPLFKEEMCAVELRVPSDTLVVYDTLNVTGVRNITGFVVADFENGFQPGWTGFVQSGADMSFNITDDIPAAQGSKYYDMGGAVDWDWLIGLIDFPATAYGAPHFPLSTDPANIYFNVMLYLPQGITNEVVLFQFREDDNGDNIYSENNEDIFSLEVKNLEAGWHQISLRYGDLATLVNGAPASPIGNGLYEPHKLFKISVLFLANPNSGYSQTLMDYLIFTTGGPLVP